MRYFLALILCLFLTTPAHAHREITGATPTMGTCGSSPSVVGNDNVGVITVGSGVVTSCALNFASTWGNAPICSVASSSTALTLGINSVSTTVLTIGASVTIGSGTIYYRCDGRQ